MGLNLKGKRAILFDMDGVLYDSMPNHAKAWSQAMNDFGMNMTPHDVYLNEGSTGLFTISKISQRERGYGATEDEVKMIYAHKAELFRNLPEAAMMPGAYQVMEKAHAAGMQILVVTGSGQKALIERVQHDYLGFVFREKMVTSFDIKRGKPFPDPYLKGLEIAGVTADQAVVVENAPLGVRSARAAGIDTVAVNTGPLEDELLQNEGCAQLFHSLQELADSWESMFE